ncbi:aldehyde dehydrogenase family protein [Umezawaea sp. Da 62-37]|uniref:aldehyde dehydrogenase family protein n=1 Tax=Umezawaea sp. Da 62-37 TaxID=3075927 RepID=UPI0028F722B9|nr:aldehyde dehydrogenase family protein [Umezawaea sp. Da 62-37]WNV85246.1 aldehyde dehydrogenase family protein [Umezawaea sp. Da 62-37]
MIDTTAIDSALADLLRGEKAWADTSLTRRRHLLDRVAALIDRHAGEWVDAAAGIKGLDPGSPLVGEEWMSGPYPTLAGVKALTGTVRKLVAGASPIDGVRVGRAPGGRVAVQVLPHGVFDTLLLNGFSAEVWLRPGIDADTARRTAGLALRDPERTQGIGVVLGAGNITSIAPLDALYELYANNRVVALKLNPITDPLLPVFTKIFKPLIDLDLLRILTGGAEVGEYLVHHDDVAHVHMTGSAVTHDAVVFGTGDAGRERKANGTPLLDKPITSELGGVSPTIVLPGAWSDADLRFQAEHVATQRLHNGGYNCVATQAVVVSSLWPQKDRFLDELRRAIAAAPDRAAYYPGSDDRVRSALDAHPGSQGLGAHRGRVLVSGIVADSALLRTEYFAPVLGVVELPHDGAEFVGRAVEFVNGNAAGTLGANLIAHPATIRSLGPVFDSAIEDLRYGTIAVNAWTGVGFLSPYAAWGAFPGNTVDDVQSGIGVVHNGFLLDGVERTVVRGPFRPAPRSVLTGQLTLTPKPPWFVGNRTAATTGRLLTGFTANPGWAKLPAIFASALRG